MHERYPCLSNVASLPQPDACVYRFFELQFSDFCVAHFALLVAMNEMLAPPFVLKETLCFAILRTNTQKKSPPHPNTARFTCCLVTGLVSMAFFRALSWASISSEVPSYAPSLS